MLTISLSLFYYIYAGLVLVFLIYSLFVAYHLLRFGFLSLVNLFVILFYFGFALLLLSISWQYIAPINWQQTITLIPNPSSSL